MQIDRKPSWLVVYETKVSGLAFVQVKYFEDELIAIEYADYVEKRHLGEVYVCKTAHRHGKAQTELAIG
jgi:hypothetical protein